MTCKACRDTGRVVHYGDRRYATIKPCTMCTKGKRVALIDPRPVPTMIPNVTEHRA